MVLMVHKRLRSCALSCLPVRVVAETLMRRDKVFQQRVEILSRYLFLMCETEYCARAVSETMPEHEVQTTKPYCLASLKFYFFKAGSEF